MSSWYDFNDLRSHNAMMSFVLSARGGGKTYSAKKLGIKNWIKYGHEFVYVRRYETEFDTIKEFFNDIAENNEFPNHEFRIIGNKGYIREKQWDEEAEANEWSTLCHFIPLSISRNFKSTPYPNVYLIFYDEVIVDTTSGQRYLKNEERILLELMSTIIRKRSGVKFIGMANNVSLVNPHFIYWGLKINPNKRFTKHPSKSIVVELWESEEFANEMKETEFGKLIDGTEYGAYAMDNKSLVDNNAFIRKRPTNLTYMLGFIIQGKGVYVWKDEDTETLYVDNVSNGESSVVYTISDVDHSPSYSTIFTLKKRPIVNVIKNCRNTTRIYYSTLTTQSLFSSIFTYL